MNLPGCALSYLPLKGGKPLRLPQQCGQTMEVHLVSQSMPNIIYSI